MESHEQKELSTDTDWQLQATLVKTSKALLPLTDTLERLSDGMVFSSPIFLPITGLKQVLPLPASLLGLDGRTPGYSFAPRGLGEEQAGMVAHSSYPMSGPWDPSVVRNLL